MWGERGGLHDAGRLGGLGKREAMWKWGLRG